MRGNELRRAIEGEEVTKRERIGEHLAFPGKAFLAMASAIDESAQRICRPIALQETMERLAERKTRSKFRPNR